MTWLESCQQSSKTLKERVTRFRLTSASNVSRTLVCPNRSYFIRIAGRGRLFFSISTATLFENYLRSDALTCFSVCGQKGEFDTYCQFVSKFFMSNNVKDTGLTRTCTMENPQCYVSLRDIFSVWIIFQFFSAYHSAAQRRHDVHDEGLRHEQPVRLAKDAEKQRLLDQRLFRHDHLLELL